jgi:hypothetical protein
MGKHRQRFEFSPRPLHQIVFSIRNQLSFQRYKANRKTRDTP